MNSVEYLVGLLKFYESILKIRFLRLNYIDSNTIMLDNNGSKFQCANNLGLRLRNCSWIFNKLSDKNIKLLKKIVYNDDNLLISVNLTGNNKIKILTYTKYGILHKKYTMKLVSINLGFIKNPNKVYKRTS